MDHRGARMSSWVEVYTRCMDGEFFRGEYCARDGHSNDTSASVTRAVEQIRAEGLEISLDELARRDVKGSLADVIVVEFERPELAPEWFRANG